MIRQLVEIVAQYALLLERSDESEIPLETAVRQQEELAFQLQQLNAEDRREFIRLLLDVARKASSPEDEEILRRLPDDTGIRET